MNSRNLYERKQDESQYQDTRKKTKDTRKKTKLIYSLQEAPVETWKLCFPPCVTQQRQLHA